MTTPEVIKAEYMSSLADLTFNSKPLINVLTMLAEENLPNARIIVEAIEEHLAKVAVDVKLPILYLVDCIVKNVGQMYTSIFSQNIASTFCTVFKVVDEKTRLEMFKLRQTWNDVFPQMKLYAIDVQIHQIDPAWPVTAQPANSIHLNPRFLMNSTPTNQANNYQKTEPSATPTPVPVKPALSATSPPSADMETLLMQEQLIQKQKELLDLQRKTLELEVLQTQVKLQEQIKAGGRRPPISTNILLAPEVANQLIPEVISNKVRPSGIAYRAYGQPKIKPVNPALTSDRPSRDPRLMRRQQQQKLQQLAQKTPVVTTTSSVHDQKAAVLESNKNLHNKSSVRDIPRDPRLSKRGNKKSKFLSKSREPFSDQKSRNIDKPLSAPPKINSNSSSSLSSGDLDSPPKTKRLPDKHRKREKPREFDSASSGKRGKLQNSNKEIREEESMGPKTEMPSNFVKNVKNTNRNYVRPNLAENTATIEDEDLRLASASSHNDNTIKVDSEQVAAKQKSPEPTPSHISSPLNKPMDVDLRHLSPTLPKKRPSPEVSERPSKKSRSFDVLFGSEDTDLRQIAVQAEEARENGAVDRPATPPPPIISAEKSIQNSVRRALPVSPIRSDLDAVRAKLANATNRDKVLSRSFHKNKLQQTTAADQNLRPNQKPKVTISPEEEEVIQSGHMTTEEGKQMLTKILTRIEKEKLREAKKKDHEESFGGVSEISSDDEFSSEITGPLKAQTHPPLSLFNDKDERLNAHQVVSQHKETTSPGMDDRNFDQFHGRGDWRAQFRPARDNWRGVRGRNATAPTLQGRQPIRPWLHQQEQPRWRGPFIPQSRPEWQSQEDESSRSPGQDLQELTIQQEETNKTIPIDGIARDIRLYGDTAIIFMNYDDPREISFQNGTRLVIFNNKEAYLLTFGSDYSDCYVNGNLLRVKLGVPSRELVINDIGFECFFGGPSKNITVGGVNMIVALVGPPPQVNIGEKKRVDLVAGKINMIVDATLMFPVFLDGKMQKFFLEGEVCTLKFIDALKRVLINDVAFNVEFGGLPKPFIINEKKHFIRFSVLPKGVRPGFVKIQNMEGESGASPVREEGTVETFSGPLVTEPLRPIKQDSQDNRSNSPSSVQSSLTNFDISNVISQSLVTAPTTGGYQVQLPPNLPSTTTPQVPAMPLLNINELFQKLVASGVVKTQEKSQEQFQESAPSFTNNRVPERAPSKAHQQENGKPQRRNLSKILKPLTFNRPETLKIRQEALYNTMYSGMQCSSCGMRFPLEASMWYSQHLDWHFRQNRRGKKNSRVANSRKWYYSLRDWKNYEELEDLEEREKNYFDQQQQQAEVAEEAEEEVEIPTVSADPRTTDERCYMCRDTFEQFFNEEKEEWHLRNAIRVEDKTYHPACYEDYQKSILDDTLDDSRNEADSQNELIPGLEIVLDDEDEDDDIVSLIDDDEEVPEPALSPAKEEEEVALEDDGDDDDVILNEVAPVRIVVDDDDDDVPTTEHNEPLVVKREKPALEDDGFVDVDEIITLKDIGQVKIKSEPVEDDFSAVDPAHTSDKRTDDEDSIKATPCEKISVPVTSHLQLITSMDGNIELSAPTTVRSTVSGGNKIKINISKPLPVITPKETSESGDSSDVIVKASEIPMEELDILNYKPALQNVPLKKLPPVQKCTELTGLCSIM